MTADDGSGKPYQPVTRDDVSDLALLPRRFDSFAAEVRTSFDVLAQQILPMLTRLTEGQNDMGAMVRSLNADLTQLSKLQSALADRVTAIEAELQRRLPSTRPKAAKRKASKSARPKLRR